MCGWLLAVSLRIQYGRVEDREIHINLLLHRFVSSFVAAIAIATAIVLIARR